jgi:hypothetical protein
MRALFPPGYATQAVHIHWHLRADKLCKHIIFVMIRVLRVPRDSPLVYQKALVDSELERIFRDVRPPAIAI